MATKAEEKKLVKRVQQWAKRMGLHEWNIAVHFQSLPGEEYALVNVHGQYLEATIVFDLDRIDKSRFSFDEVATHELAHLLAAPMGDLLDRLSKDDEVMQKIVNDAEDLVVTRFSRIVLALHGKTL